MMPKYLLYLNSSINEALKNEGIPNIFRILVPGKDEVGVTSLGDPAYPLLPYVMKEYPHFHDESYSIFNQVLRDSRNPVECAYGRLKARWLN